MEQSKREEEEENSWEVVLTHFSNDEENTAPSPSHGHPKSMSTLEVINTEHDLGYKESIDGYSFVIDSPTNMVSSSKGKDRKEAKTSSCSHFDHKLDDKTLQEQEIYFNPIFPTQGDRIRTRIHQFELDDDESVSTLHKEEDEAITEEIKHLQKRISNVRQSIQLSSTSLQLPSNWEQNCLNSVKNCIVEWKAILSAYQPTTAPSSFVENTFDHLEDDLSYDSILQHPLHPDSEQSKAIALELFGLLQLSMQCGPLSGSNAGYFKRCGGAVAQTAHMFLTGCVAGDVTQQFRFTERQQHAIRKWIAASKKAVEVNNGPSKSILKLQQKAVRAKKSARKKKGKNQ